MTGDADSTADESDGATNDHGATVDDHDATADDHGTKTNDHDATADDYGATTVAFVCVQNAGRSQMAFAFARREREARGLDDEVSLVTGGTRPADRVHPEVVDAMREVGVDVSGRTPREVTVDELRSSDYVVTMGCSASDACPAGWGGESRDWDLEDPDGRAPGKVAAIRDEIRRRVSAFFDELQRVE